MAPFRGISCRSADALVFGRWANKTRWKTPFPAPVSMSRLRWVGKKQRQSKFDCDFFFSNFFPIFYFTFFIFLFVFDFKRVNTKCRHTFSRLAGYLKRSLGLWQIYGPLNIWIAHMGPPSCPLHHSFSTANANGESARLFAGTKMSRSHLRDCQEMDKSLR